VAEQSGEGDSNGELRELESTAETLRNLYNGYLRKYKEINSAQTETVPVQNAYVITKASPQLYKSQKKTLVLFGGSLAFCLFLGAGAAVGREWVADVFRTSRAVEQVTGMYCVVLPLVETTTTRIEEYVLAAPYSRFAESLRNIRATIDATSTSNGARVIGIVSSVPKEGKTVVAANLGALTTLSAGARTLVIDSDLHLRKLTDALASDARDGLIEALDDPSRLSSLVVRRERSGLDVLPCVVRDRIPNAAELLGSAKMERLLAAARRHYDYIIIEIAPIMSVVDVKMVERFIDGFLFVTEWGQTKRQIVVDALSEAQVIHDRVFGVILNKVDATAMRMIEVSKGTKASDYYQE
jgi:succinoglycan biosynthesis transport protein ExoP